jgi:hypothetical protein
MKHCLGKYNSDVRVIFLHPKVLNDQAMYDETIRHEVAHAALDLAGLSGNTSGLLKHRTEEAVVAAMTTLWLPAVKWLDQRGQ